MDRVLSPVLGFLGPPLCCLEPDAVPAPRPLPRRPPPFLVGAHPRPPPLSSGDLPSHLGTSPAGSAPSRPRAPPAPGGGISVRFSALHRPSRRPAHRPAPPRALRAGNPSAPATAPLGAPSSFVLGQQLGWLPPLHFSPGSVSLSLFLFLPHFLVHPLSFKPCVFTVFI